MIIYLLLLIAVLFSGAKIASKNQFHEDFLSLKVSKRIQGGCAIAIMFHHLIQNIIDNKQDPGLMSIFYHAGYLFVAIFFFFSGYGLYVSYKNKKDYLNGFLKKRLPTVLVPLFLINAIYTIIVLIGDNELYGDLNPLTMVGRNIINIITTFLCITPMNSKSWFVIAITIFYIVFYLAFKKSRDENRAIRRIGVFLIIYALIGASLPPIGFYWLEGEWWYNASFIFFIGILFGKNQEKILSFAKEKYKLLLPISFAGTLAAWYLSITLDKTTGAYGHGIEGFKGAVICYLAKTVVEILFVSFVLLLAMKIKTNNKVLDLLGDNSFEIYLMHGLFIGMLRSPVIFIENPIVYILAVLVLSLISAFIINKVDSVLVKKVKQFLTEQYV